MFICTLLAQKKRKKGSSDYSDGYDGDGRCERLNSGQGPWVKIAKLKFKLVGVGCGIVDQNYGGSLTLS